MSVRKRAVTTMAALATMGGFALAGPVTAAPSYATRPRDAVQRDLDRLVAQDGYPAVLAHVRAADGDVRDYTAGVAEVGTHKRVPVDSQIRIGSATKAFVSVVVLQLVGAGKIELEAPVETYLPNLVRGENIDGREITVRQLLQHTSGLPNYTDEIALNFGQYQHRYLEPRELLDRALAKQGTPADQAEFSYSNTNYLLAGLIVQKVTGRPIGEEITNRIVKPLGLRNTYFPGVGEQEIRGRHPHGYFGGPEGGTPDDVTVMDPSWGWAAGQMVSTPSEVTRFFTALLGGWLLRPAELAEMRTTIPAKGLPDGLSYGLGLFSTKLSCGGLVWGHGGTIPGYLTRVGVAEDGRTITVAATLVDVAKDNAGLDAAIDAAMCR